MIKNKQLGDWFFAVLDDAGIWVKASDPEDPAGVIYYLESRSYETLAALYNSVRTEEAVRDDAKD